MVCWLARRDSVCYCGIIDLRMKGYNTKDGKMTRLELPNELAQAIQAEAVERGLTVADFLQSVLRREKTLTDRRKIEQAQDWWMSQPLHVRAKYEGMFVAVHDQQLIDYDADEDLLIQRVRTKFGNTPVLIIPAEGQRDIWVYSPRLLPV